MVVFILQSIAVRKVLETVGSLVKRLENNSNLAFVMSLMKSGTVRRQYSTSLAVDFKKHATDRAEKRLRMSLIRAGKQGNI